MLDYLYLLISNFYNKNGERDIPRISAVGCIATLIVLNLFTVDWMLYNFNVTKEIVMNEALIIVIFFVIISLLLLYFHKVKELNKVVDMEEKLSKFRRSVKIISAVYVFVSILLFSLLLIYGKSG